MRISDWSSDVCSSDLRTEHRRRHGITNALAGGDDPANGMPADLRRRRRDHHEQRIREETRLGHSGESSGPGDEDRKSVVEGKSVSVRVDLGGRRIIKKKKNEHK